MNDLDMACKNSTEEKRKADVEKFDTMCNLFFKYLNLQKKSTNKC